MLGHPCRLPFLLWLPLNIGGGARSFWEASHRTGQVGEGTSLCFRGTFPGPLSCSLRRLGTPLLSCLLPLNPSCTCLRTVSLRKGIPSLGLIPRTIVLPFSFRLSPRVDSATGTQRSVSSVASKSETVSRVESDGTDSTPAGLPPGQFQLAKSRRQKRRRLEA